MAIKREQIINNDSEINKSTVTPSSVAKDVRSTKDQTFDSIGVLEDYKDGPESSRDAINTGAMIPKDMTVRLVRADSANWEIFISLLYSLSLTFFGVFLGSWISDSAKEVPSFTNLEMISTIFLGLLSLILISVWGWLKYQQQKNCILIPHETLNMYKEELPSK